MKKLLLCLCAFIASTAMAGQCLRADEITISRNSTGDGFSVKLPDNSKYTYGASEINPESPKDGALNISFMGVKFPGYRGPNYKTNKKKSTFKDVLVWRRITCAYGVTKGLGNVLQEAPLGNMIGWFVLIKKVSEDTKAYDLTGDWSFDDPWSEEFKCEAVDSGDPSNCQFEKRPSLS